MKPVTFTLCVETIDDRYISCHIFNTSEDNKLRYDITTGMVSLTKQNQLAATVRKNIHQLQKILRSALNGNLHLGQVINCVFLEGFPFLHDHTFHKFIRLDRRNNRMHISTSDSGLANVHKIYADGSCNPDTRQSGYGGFIETPDGATDPFHQSIIGGSSNLMELLAITEGLQRLLPQKIIQVNTDSRFVIRGLVQWVHFWKHNNWQTAHGRHVKYAEHWQQAYRLCEGKYIEFRWIKGHSGNAEQEFCHLLAKSTTES